MFIAIKKLTRLLTQSSKIVSFEELCGLNKLLWDIDDDNDLWRSVYRRPDVHFPLYGLDRFVDTARTNWSAV